jgi:maleate isomerase
MSIEYAPRGLIGVLTPQANTTVEPELAILLPPGVAAISARLLSKKATIEERLVEFFEALDDTIAQFADAPINAIAVACTGSSYLVGTERERQALQRLEQRLNIPVLTAAIAVVDALRSIDARKIGLVSPYPPELTQSSIGYWQRQGFAISAVASVESVESSFHPIYSIASGRALSALDRVDGSECDAIVMLGTGMPTLRPIRERSHLGRAPVLSSNLCLAWRTVTALDHAKPSGEVLLRWVDGVDWGNRLGDRVPAMA